MFTALSSLLCIFAYRLRGGGFVALGNSWYARLVWAAAFALAGLFLGYGALSALSLFATGALMMLIPHAFAQNVGRWDWLQATWFTKWLPPLFKFGPLEKKDDVWIFVWLQELTWKRALFDCVQLAIIGLIRSTIVAAPLAAFSLMSVPHTLRLVIAFTLLHPLAYYLGWLVPFSLGPSLQKNSNNWPEAFTGFAWAVTLILAGG